eukprot:767704-Hanusia_phi.AAC.2
MSVYCLFTISHLTSFLLLSSCSSSSLPPPLPPLSLTPSGSALTPFPQTEITVTVTAIGPVVNFHVTNVLHQPQPPGPRQSEPRIRDFRPGRPGLKSLSDLVARVLGQDRVLGSTFLVLCEAQTLHSQQSTCYFPSSPPSTFNSSSGSAFFAPVGVTGSESEEARMPWKPSMTLSANRSDNENRRKGRNVGGRGRKGGGEQSERAEKERAPAGDESLQNYSGRNA